MRLRCFKVLVALLVVSSVVGFPPAERACKAEEWRRVGEFQAKPERNKDPKDALVWASSLEEGFRQSKVTGRPILVHGWAVWCTQSIEMAGKTFRDPAMRPVLARFELVALDMDDEQNEAVWDRYGIRGLPWLAVLDSEGSLVSAIDLDRLPAAPDFARELGSDLLGKLSKPESTKGTIIPDWDSLKLGGDFSFLHRTYLRTQLGKIGPCYRKANQRKHIPRDSATLAFTIEQQGKPTKPRFLSATRPEDMKLAACVRKNVLTWNFPSSEKGVVTVSITIGWELMAAAEKTPVE